jgi:hypothetical protein
MSSFFYKENITTAAKYAKPNNNTAVAISSNHIFISNLHYDITIQDQINTTVTNPTAPKIPKKSSIMQSQIKK